METYVAVKPWLEFPLYLLKGVRALRDFKEKPDDHDSERYFRAVLDQFEALFMQEALLFDKIYILDPSPDPDPFFRLINEIAEVSGHIFSFIDTLDTLHKMRPTDVPSPLLAFGDIAAKKSVKSYKVMAEYRRKFPELQRGADGSFKHRERKATADEERKWHQDLDKMLRKLGKSIVEDLYPFSDYLTRLEALQLEYFENVVATPLLSYNSYSQRLPASRRHDIAQLVIHNLPVPDRDTKWEKIIEFRENPDNRKDLLGLRRWIRKISAEDLSPAECAEELEWLQNEFQAHLRLHKIKTDTATLEVMVKTPLEILENLVTLKFSKLVDPLFAVKKRRVSLIEAELNAPGREIAYLIKAKQAFE